MGSEATVYVVVLNWNGWEDTIECLESLQHLDQTPYVIILCDNGSSDSSLERIRDWADGGVAAATTEFPPFNRFGVTPKPIPYLDLKRHEIGAKLRGDHRLVLIDNGGNLGFAGGNNVGIRYALSHDDCAYVWVLNNDTVVDPDAAQAMVRAFAADRSLGMCGSQIRFYAKPAVIQSYGGTLNRLFCTTMNLFNGVPADAVKRAPQDIDFVPGASMMVSKAFVDRIGLMAEDYFLYFEEIDWAQRGKRAFRLAVAKDSIVYHRGGSSIGSPRASGIAGVRSEYFLLHNRLVFARKFFPWTAAVVAAGLVVSVAKRAFRGRWRHAQIAACALLGIVPKALRQANSPALAQRAQHS